MVLENPHRKKLGGQKARGTMKKLWRLICILPPTPLLAHNKPSKHTVNHWIEWCTSWVPDVSTAPINGPVTAIQDLQPDLMAHGKVSVFYDAADDHWAEKVTESSFSPLVVVVGRSVTSDSLRPHGLQHTRLPVFHYLLEFAQTYARWVSDAIQPSHPLSSPTPPAFNLFQHQGLFPMSQLFASGGQSIGASTSASVLPMNIQGWFTFGLTGLILLSKGLFFINFISPDWLVFIVTLLPFPNFAIKPKVVLPSFWGTDFLILSENLLLASVVLLSASSVLNCPCRVTDRETAFSEPDAQHPRSGCGAPGVTVWASASV